LEDKCFIENSPDLVIIESVEKTVLSLSEIIPKDQNISNNNILNKLTRRYKLSNAFVLKIAIYVDRLKKEAFINYLYARLAEIPGKIITGDFNKKQSVISQELDIPTGTSEMVFYSEPDEYFKDWKQSHIDRVIYTLKSYEKELSKIGTKLIFMPIPNKENIYWELVLGGKSNNNLKRIEDVEKRE
jgi:hypothetical protein